MPKNKKSTKAVMEARLNIVVTMVSRYSRREIIGYVRDQTDWNLSVKQIEVYIKKATDIMMAQFEDARRTGAQRSYNNVSKMLNSALDEEDLKTALQMQEKLDKLIGLDQIKKIQLETTNLNINKEVADDMTPQQASQLYSEIVKGL